MAITIKDVKLYLEKYPEQTPVYWGVNALPCWVTCAEATMEDFKKVMFADKNAGGIEFIYIEYCGLVKEHANRNVNRGEYWKDKYVELKVAVGGSFWDRLRFIIFGSK